MEAQFTKPELSVIDYSSITLECVEQQLKSMQLGYISHCFIVKGLEEDYDLFYELNFKDTSEEIMEKAAEHASKHLKTMTHLEGDNLKTIPQDVQQAIQGLIMIKEKRDEIMANVSKTETMKRNIAWLKELEADMKNPKEKLVETPIKKAARDDDPLSQE